MYIPFCVICEDDTTALLPLGPIVIFFDNTACMELVRASCLCSYVKLLHNRMNYD